MSKEPFNWDASYIDVLQLADLIRQPVHFITPDGTVQFVNRAWENTYKLSRQEVIHRNISSIDEVTKTMNYYLSLDDIQHELTDSIVDLAYNYLKVPTNTPACLQAIEKKREVVVVSQMPDGGQVVVRSTPIFNDEDLVLVFTQIQDLTMMSKWKDELEQEIEKNNRMQEELQYLRDHQAATNLVGNSKEMISLRKLISVIAKSDASVLITGESGVGKEVVAKEIYNKSLRSDGPFISVNCAAIPENLLESELFGYEKGAFTGAFKQKIGLFEVADGGTIMLDEIGEFPIHLQPKLLRVLQEREIRRVGGTHNIPINVRVISATNRDLLQQVNEGKFRCDLYYRLNVVPILIPPLRQRREDVALLASSFLMQFNKKYKTSKFFLSQAVILLEQHDWLGNVRELENVVERLVIVSSGNAITPQQILTVFSGKLNMDTNTESASEFSLKEAVEQLEKKMISEALSNYKSTYKAAKILGMSQSTLVRKAKQLNIKSAKKAGLPE